MKYEIIESSSPAGLAEQVQKRVDEGWRPTGGAQVYTIKQRGWYDTTLEENYFIQAITRESAPAAIPADQAVVHE